MYNPAKTNQIPKSTKSRQNKTLPHTKNKPTDIFFVPACFSLYGPQALASEILSTQLTHTEPNQLVPQTLGAIL